MDSRKLDVEVAPKEEEKLWFNEHLILLGRLVIANLLYQMIRKLRTPENVCLLALGASKAFYWSIKIFGN